ncbi:MAG TPA: GDP-mannose 4,6-dehydratase [Candidatus Acidoferrales bacterium]|nr:GDP-mannose 4,6-dehydratase [Candidatus Acidoferrales bacterium]
MKIFVTGGAGFIGSEFIRVVLSLDKGYTVANYDDLTYAGNLANLKSVADEPSYEFVKGDICDATAVERAMDGCDWVVHFAAESHVDRSIYEPSAAIQTNVTGTFMLLQVARKLRIKRFLHISTDEVYGDMAAGAFADESSPIKPSSPYSASKAGSDLLVASYVRTYGFPALITRSSNNYGPFQFPEKFLPLLITNALEDKPLPIYGDGKQQRDWLHVRDNCLAEVPVRNAVGERREHECRGLERVIGAWRRRPQDISSLVAERRDGGAEVGQELEPQVAVRERDHYSAAREDTSPASRGLCWCQSSWMDSSGRPLVSGTKRMTNSAARIEQTPYTQYAKPWLKWALR